MNSNKSILLTVIALALLAVGLSQAIQMRGPDPAAARFTAPQVYDATGAREAAIVYPKDPQLPRPVYDATGAMLKAITPKVVKFGPVYDATGAMQAAINPKPAATAIFAPVYDATGAMLDAVVYP